MKQMFWKRNIQIALPVIRYRIIKTNICNSFNKFFNNINIKYKINLNNKIQNSILCIYKK